MDRQRKADMMLVLATGFWGISNCLIAICLRDMQPVTLNAFRFLSAFVVLGAVSPAFAFGGSNRQVELLKNEGVGFTDESHVDMARFCVRALPYIAE